MLGEKAIEAGGGRQEPDILPNQRPLGAHAAFNGTGTAHSLDAYGVEIGYDFASIQGLRTDTFLTMSNTPAIASNVRLDPTVMLVPIQLVRVLPAAGGRRRSNVAGSVCDLGQAPTAATAFIAPQTALSMASGLMGPYTVAHEMGLILGLNEYNCDPNGLPPPTVMCIEQDAQNATVSAEDCAIARRNAKQFVFRKWGVTVQP